MNDIQKIIKNVDKIPTLPIVVTRLVDLVKNPRTSAKDIQDVIARDQSLSARVLKLVNSAFYGFSERISSISHAIVILGFNAIKNVALSASVFEIFGSLESKTTLDKEGFWMHSLAVAGTSRFIASKLKLPVVEEIFMGGLLHDIGKIILDQFAHEQYAQVMAYVAEKNCLILDAEQHVLDLTHMQVGAYLTTSWHMPPALTQMIGMHHRPTLAGEFVKATFCIHCADILVRAMGIGSGGDRKIPEINRELWVSLGMDITQIQTYVENIQRELQDVTQFMYGT